MRKRFLCALLVAMAVNCFGQPKVVVDSQLKKLADKHIAYNKAKRSSPGYRVQIHFGNVRQKAQDIKSECENLFPNTPVYLTYQAPNFKVRIGDCKTRWEATKILEEVKTSFEVAFIVKDDIALPKF